MEVWRREVACSDLLSEMIPCCVLNTAEGVGDAGDDAGDTGDSGDVGKGSQ